MIMKSDFIIKIRSIIFYIILSILILPIILMILDYIIRPIEIADCVFLCTKILNWSYLFLLFILFYLFPILILLFLNYTNNNNYSA